MSVEDHAPAFNDAAPAAQNAPTSAPPFAIAPTPDPPRLGAPSANVGARSALARDSAPLVNSPTRRGTVDRRVTVPETCLLTPLAIFARRMKWLRKPSPSRTLYW